MIVHNKAKIQKKKSIMDWWHNTKPEVSKSLIPSPWTTKVRPWSAIMQQELPNYSKSSKNPNPNKPSSTENDTGWTGQRILN